MKKKLLSTILCGAVLSLALTGCKADPSTNNSSAGNGNEKVTITLAAAASLQNAYVDKLIPMFEKKYDYITVEGTYDSSGKLQTQIESGLEADVFMSAAKKQMTALTDEDMIDKDSVVNLLENKLVLIVPSDSTLDITGFEDITKASMIAVGDPDSVPAGQYAKEAFTNLGIWDDVLAKASLGTNVTEVLSWVESASADAGVVYATDAASSDKVKVISEAPKDSLEKPVIYPVGILSESAHSKEAALFVEFLQSEEALAVFEEYGFSIVE